MSAIEDLTRTIREREAEVDAEMAKRRADLREALAKEK